MKETCKMAQLNVGDSAPDFTALTDEGKKVKLSDYRGKRVVVYFYPADDTPGCTTQACSFRDNYAEIEERNATVLGVSPDNQSSHQKFKTKYNLPFTLLVDEDHAITEAYGAWGEKTRPNGEKYTGVIRSHVVVDENGKVIDTRYNVKADASMPEALSVLSA
jgi:peroxiredoxin Q/BCP